MNILKNYRLYYWLFASSLIILIFFDQAHGQTATRQIDPNYKAAVRIHNPNNTTLKFKCRWGSNEWKNTTIQPFQTMIYHYHYYRGDYSSPDFNVRYDWITGDGKFTPMIKSLKRTKVRSSELNKANSYYFKYSGNQLLLYKFQSYDRNWVSAVKVENRTQNVINYQWQWQGSSTWNKVALKPGFNKWFTRSYYPGIYNSPAYKIRFDNVLGDGRTTWKYYDLDRKKSPINKPQNHAKLYYFSSPKNSVIDIFDPEK